LEEVPLENEDADCGHGSLGRFGWLRPCANAYSVSNQHAISNQYALSDVHAAPYSHAESNLYPVSNLDADALADRYACAYGDFDASGHEHTSAPHSRR
jgi:hypothetical protein